MSKQTPMPAIHLVDHHEVDLVDIDRNEWHSGYWRLSEETAQRLVGANLYLHRATDAPSHIGGRISYYHVHPKGVEAGRIVFHFHASVECSNVLAPHASWNDEVNIVW
jgi:hypothetical protein